MAVNGRWSVVDKDDKEASGKEAKKIMSLLATPNPIQDWNTFFMYAKTMNQIFGRAYIYMEKPVGMGVENMYVLPNWCIVAQYRQSDDEDRFMPHPYRFDVTLSGKTYHLQPEDMMIWNDVGFDLANMNYDFTQGGSRLLSLADPISNIIASYEARNVQLTNAGPPGILSPDGKDAVGGYVPLLQDQKEALQTELKRRYGLQRDKWQTLISTEAVKYSVMGKPTKDLMVFEEIEDDVRQLCDNYGYPMYLFGFKAGTTFSNLKEAKVAAYQNAIIPESQSFNRIFDKYMDLQKSGLRLVVSYDHIEEMQKSEKEKAETLKLYIDAYGILYDKGLINEQQYLDYAGINLTEQMR